MYNLALLFVLFAAAASQPPADQPAVVEFLPPGTSLGGWISSGQPVRQDAVGTVSIAVPVTGPFVPCGDTSWRIVFYYRAVGVDLKEGFARFFRETGLKDASSGDVIAWVYANTPHSYQLYTVSAQSDDVPTQEAVWRLGFRIEAFFGRLPPVYPPPDGWRRRGCESGHCQENRRFWPDYITAEMVPRELTPWLNDELPCDLPAQRPASDIFAVTIASRALQTITGSTAVVSRVELMLSATEYSPATQRSSYFWAIEASTSPDRPWLVRVDPCSLSLISIEPRPRRWAAPNPGMQRTRYARR